MAVVFEIPAEGAGLLIARALELLVEIEQSDEALLPDSVVNDARNLRSVVDEWVEFRVEAA